jgi:hypothetical protein
MRRNQQIARAKKKTHQNVGQLQVDDDVYYMKQE